MTKNFRKFSQGLNKFIKSSKYIHGYHHKITESDRNRGVDIYSFDSGGIKYNIHNLNNVIDNVLRDDFYGRLITRGDLQSIILSDMSRHKNFNQNPNPIVQHIIYKLTNDTFNYTCFLPITGLDINESVKMGSVTFINGKYENQIISHDIKGRKPYLIHLCHPNFAIIKDFAITRNGSLKFAKKLIRLVLNLLMVISSVGPTQQYSLMIGEKYIDMGLNSFLSIDKDGHVGHNVQFAKYKVTSYPSQKIYNVKSNTYAKELLEIINKALQSRYLTPMEMGICLATNLIADAINTDYTSVKFIEFTSALEALLENDTPNITKDISNKVSVLLGNDNNIDQIRNQMTHLYDVRSRIVHGSYIYVSNADMVSIWDISRKIIKIISTNLSKFNDSKSKPKYKLNQYVEKRLKEIGR